MYILIKGSHQEWVPLKQFTYVLIEAGLPPLEVDTEVDTEGREMDTEGEGRCIKEACKMLVWVS